MFSDFGNSLNLSNNLLERKLIHCIFSSLFPLCRDRLFTDHIFNFKIKKYVHSTQSVSLERHANEIGL